MTTGLGEYRGYVYAVSIVALFAFLTAITPPQLINSNVNGATILNSQSQSYFDPAALGQLAVSFNLTLGNFTSANYNMKLQTGTTFGTPEGILMNIISTGEIQFNNITMYETKIFTIFTYSGVNYDWYCNGHAYATKTSFYNLTKEAGISGPHMLSCTARGPSGGRTISVFFAWNYAVYGTNMTQAAAACTGAMFYQYLTCINGTGVQMLVGITWDNLAQTANAWDFISRLFSFTLPSADPTVNFIFILLVVLPSAWIIMKLILGLIPFLNS